MKIMVKRVGKNPVVEDIEDKLSVYQEIVGGHIEVFPLWDGILCVCNGDAKMQGKLPNFTFYDTIICGDVIFISASGEDFVGLTDIQIEMLKILFNL